MNLTVRFLAPHSHRTTVFSWSLGKRCLNLSRSSRNYATHRDALDPSLLSQSLDTKQGPARESVGPFKLGLSQTQLAQQPKVKKWSELSTTGKGVFICFECCLYSADRFTVLVQRTTERTTNLTVILLGAGLSAVLIYCLTSELFSKNSPTVLHNDACDRINASPQVRPRI